MLVWSLLRPDLCTARSRLLVPPRNGGASGTDISVTRHGGAPTPVSAFDRRWATRLRFAASSDDWVAGVNTASSPGWWLPEFNRPSKIDRGFVFPSNYRNPLSPWRRQ